MLQGLYSVSLFVSKFPYSRLPICYKVHITIRVNGSIKQNTKMLEDLYHHSWLNFPHGKSPTCYNIYIIKGPYNRLPTRYKVYVIIRVKVD